MDIHSFILSPWFWLALTVIFTLIELACAFNLITIWFAFSALFMILISGFTELFDVTIKFKFQIGIFLLLSAALLVFTRPVAIKKFKTGKIKTNVDDLAGRDVLITKKITKYEKGEAKIKGQIWTAISENDEEINENAECQIVKVDGVKLVVKKK